MPVVPKINVDRACSLGEEHQQVDSEAHGDDERSHGRVVGNGCGSGPAHVEYMQLQIVDADHRVESRAEAGCEPGGDYRQSHESYTHLKSAFKSVAEFDADAQSEYGEDYWHHHRRTKSDYIFENFFHCSANLFYGDFQRALRLAIGAFQLLLPLVHSGDIAFAPS